MYHGKKDFCLNWWLTQFIVCEGSQKWFLLVRSPAKIDLYLNNNKKKKTLFLQEKLVLLKMESCTYYCGILSRSIFWILKEYLQGEFSMEETFYILQSCSSFEFNKHPRKGNRELPYWTEVTFMTVLWRKLGLLVTFLSSIVADAKHYGKWVW